MDYKRISEEVEKGYSDFLKTYRKKYSEIKKLATRSLFLNLPEYGNMYNCCNGYIMVLDEVNGKVLVMEDYLNTRRSSISVPIELSEKSSGWDKVLTNKEFIPAFLVLLDDDVWDMTRELWDGFYTDLDKLVESTVYLGNCLWADLKPDSKRSKREKSGVLSKVIIDHSGLKYGIDSMVVFDRYGFTENVPCSFTHWDFITCLCNLENNLVKETLVDNN